MNSKLELYTTMEQNAGLEDELYQAAVGDDADALSRLLAIHRDRLLSMVRLRIHPQIRSRVDASDIVQEALFDASKKFREYSAAPKLSLYLWLRHLTGLKLFEVHRKHLGTGKRDARMDVPLDRLGLPNAHSTSVVDELADSITSPSQAAMKLELRRQLYEALDSLDTLDREVLVLRHFEQLTTSETAEALGIPRSTAGNRYLKAVERLQAVMETFPDLVEGKRLT